MGLSDRRPCMLIDGTLEIDEKSGVISFYDKDGIKRLRIRKLPKPISTENQIIDITVVFCKVNYKP